MMRYTPPITVSPSGRAAPVTTYVWSGSRRGLRHRLGGVAMSVLALLGALTALTTVAAAAFDLRPLVVRSGSMEPSLPVGALAIVRPVPADQVDAGAVISVVRGDGTRITHRVVTAEGEGPLRRLTTQGDANATPDVEQVTAAQVDRLVLQLPSAGRLLQASQTPQALFVVGVLSGGALLWIFGPPTARHVGHWVPETPRRVRGAS
jgi:signal peptidase I